MCHMRKITGEVDIPADWNWNLPEGAYVKNGLVYGGKPIGVGGAYCGCQRAGRCGFISFEDAELLKLPDLKTMCLDKESDNA